MINVTRYCCLFLFALVGITTQAEVYVWHDTNGQKHYSDKPQPGATQLAINPDYAWLTVRYVYDGDTVILDNDQKIRLSGINTPEIESRHRAGEPLGQRAKQWLAAQIEGKKVRLETGPEKHDKYGRLIAHLFNQQGEHLNRLLLKNGLAFVTIHPPNLKYVESLLAAQREAENAKRGLWGNPYYASQDFQLIKGKFNKGWKRITGRVKKIQQTRRNVYLKFSDQFAVKISRKFLPLFPDLETYRDKKIEARGWIHKSRYGYNLMIRHPVDIVVFAE